MRLKARSKEMTPMPSLPRQSLLVLQAVSTAYLTGAMLVGLMVVEATKARAGDLLVRYDQSQLVRLPRPVSEIIIGNPSIADVSVQSGNLLVVTGKTFGVTNIIALDAEHNVIEDQRIIVERDEARIVNLHKGAARESFTCTPSCSPTLTIGDDVKYFDTISKHSQTKTKFSDSSQENSQQGQQQ